MRYALSLILLLPQFFCFAQTYSEYSYTTKDGLPSAIVYSTLIRKNGELMIGTANGLSRFNGKEFTNYDLTDGLISLSIFCLFEDSRSRLWVGTSKGICEFRNGKFYSQKYESETPTWLGGFAEIDGVVYAWSATGLLALQAGKWIRSTITPRGIPCSQINAYRAGYVIAAGSKLFFYENKKIRRLPNTEGYDLWRAKSLNDSLILLSKGGFYLYENNKPIHIYTPADSALVIAFEIINKKIWFSIEGKGVFELDIKSKSAKPIRSKEGDWNTVISLEQKNNIVWIGGLGGLTRLLMNEKMKFLQSDETSAYRVAAANRFTGTTYLLSRGSETIISELKNEKITQRKIDKFKGYPRNFLIDKLLFTRPDEAIALTRFAAAYRINFSGKYIEKLFDDSVKIFDACINKITGQVFFATSRKLFLLAGDLSVVDSLPIISYCIKALSNGSVLIQHDSQLSLYKNRKLSTALSNLNSGGRFDFSMSENSKGIISLRERGRGVKFYQWEGPRLKEIAHLSKSSGLTTNNVYKVVFDKNNVGWIHSESGVSLFDVDHRFPDGSLPVKNLRFLPVAANNWEYTDLTLVPSGQLILTTPQGIIYFDSARQKVEELPPALSISGAEIINNSTAATTSFPFSEHNVIKLARDQSTFQVAYQAVSFVNSEDVTYSYRMLNGEDTAWSKPVRSTTVSFLNLSPGAYQFEVRARKTNSYWSAPASMRLSIQPAFWETTAFKLIMILNLIFIIGFIFQMRMKKIRRSAYMKSKLTDLEMKALRAQLNPHFIYNALNSIQSLIASGKQKDAMRYVSKFGKLLRLILEYSEEGKTTLQREIDVNSLYIELERLRLGFDFSVTITIAEDIAAEEEKVPALILQPIIENALWHGLTNIKDDKHLIIEVSSTDVYLIIGVTDNGLGIEATSQQNPKSTEKRKSFGSQIVRKRLLTYNRDSEEPIHIRDLKEVGKRGTEVKIFIKRIV